ncbi:PREDICTED: transcription factor Adf-1-like [Rhagoletis zephyria]|uniref:transcription factor Adf-1-like n=1 Tax=Rhagoletis zephyria TaxID=28612 RepID=UPI0008113DA5|nr:PREDICTED: transcription factor Adf-1-like [Rhagoletis zephyria]
MMDDERLISLVEPNKDLYDKFSPGYKLADAKRQIWAKIGEQLNRPGDHCAQRWLSIRERYSRELRRLNEPSRSGAKRERVWPLMESLQFLKKVVISRPCRTSKNILNSPLPSTSQRPSYNEQLVVNVASPSAPSEPENIPVPLEIVSPSILEESNASMLYQLSSPSQEFSADSNSTLLSLSSQNKRKMPRGKEPDLDAVFFESAEMFKKACKAIEASEGEQNPTVHAFAKMIGATITQMSAAKQYIAMERVTAIVMALQRRPEP